MPTQHLLDSDSRLNCLNRSDALLLVPLDLLNSVLDAGVPDKRLEGFSKGGFHGWESEVFHPCGIASLYVLDCMLGGTDECLQAFYDIFVCLLTVCQLPFKPANCWGELVCVLGVSSSGLHWQ